MGMYDHILRCADGDKDTALVVPLDGWEPWEPGGSGIVDDGVYAFRIDNAEVVTKREGAKIPGKNLHLHLVLTEPKAFAGVPIHSWHGIPVGEATDANGQVNAQYGRDLGRIQSIVASILSDTAGRLEQARAPGAKPIQITARALIGKTVYGETRQRKWAGNRGDERESSEIAQYVLREVYTAKAGPAQKIGAAPVEQKQIPEVTDLGGAVGGAADGSAKGGRTALDQALGL